MQSLLFKGKPLVVTTSLVQAAASVTRVWSPLCSLPATNRASWLRCEKAATHSSVSLEDFNKAAFVLACLARGADKHLLRCYFRRRTFSKETKRASTPQLTGDAGL
jgi:hypothetical protein